MTDPHLNLFYSYNQDNELIENNLTRAWIVTLRMLSAETRNLFLQTVLKDHFLVAREELPSFGASHFALQGNIDKHQARQFSQKYVLTIATQREFESGLFQPGGGDSIPDAWIYDDEQGYCFLIESKVGGNPLNAEQVHRHAKIWFGIDNQTEPGNFENQLISLAWLDILKIAKNPVIDIANSQEQLLLQEFASFLGFFGYRLFRGFEFRSLQDIPSFSLTQIEVANSTKFLDFSNLQEAPNFHFGNTDG